jgi:L-fuculose-phosphate aldolase
LPCIVEDMAQIIGGPVRCSRYVRGGQHLELAQAAVEALGNDASAVILASHGVVVGGRDLAEAIVAARILDKAAMLFTYANMLGGANVIPDEPVRAERHRYLYKYGNASDFEVGEGKVE